MFPHSAFNFLLLMRKLGFTKAKICYLSNLGNCNRQRSSDEKQKLSVIMLRHYFCKPLLESLASPVPSLPSSHPLTSSHLPLSPHKKRMKTEEDMPGLNIKNRLLAKGRKVSRSAFCYKAKVQRQFSTHPSLVGPPSTPSYKNALRIERYTRGRFRNKGSSYPPTFILKTSSHPQKQERYGNTKLVPSPTSSIF